MSKRKTNDEFILELKNKAPSIQPLEPYLRSTKQKLSVAVKSVVMNGLVYLTIYYEALAVCGAQGHFD